MSINNTYILTLVYTKQYWIIAGKVSLHSDTDLLPMITVVVFRIWQLQKCFLIKTLLSTKF